MLAFKAPLEIGAMDGGGALAEQSRAWRTASAPGIISPACYPTFGGSIEGTSPKVRGYIPSTCLFLGQNLVVPCLGCQLLRSQLLCSTGITSWGFM